MSLRRVKLVLLCEDNQHETFFRRFFQLAGWHKRSIRVEKNPRGRGSGEQWVRQNFSKELREQRRRQVSTVLVAVIDGDNLTVQERLASMDSACIAVGIPVRNPDEPVIVVVPRRNIETWIAYLSGKEVNEEDTYPRLSRERECVEHVTRLKQMCDDGTLRKPAPLSLQSACDEYHRTIDSL